VILTQIAKRFEFSAAHHLTGLRAGHPCAEPHGHNYDVELILSGPVDRSCGMVLDYLAMAPFKAYVDKLDHHDLNELLPGIEPTAENLASYLFVCALKLWPVEGPTAVRVVAVKVSETPKTWAEARQGDLGFGL
jgi:6-pyruvoyltetrahydropterin/6-carboxytetrahydropterin synthase